jgi:VRR-NUC domain
VPRSKYLKSGELSEEAIHKAVMDWVRLKPTIKKLVMHFPNEGKRTPSFGRLMKEMGMRAGVSDLFISMARHGYHGAWIELKTKNGVLSSLQKEFLDDMSAQNYFTIICRSIDECIKTIQWYCF